MLTPQEQALIAEIRANAKPSGADDGRTKSDLRRGQRRLLAIIDRITAYPPALLVTMPLNPEILDEMRRRSQAIVLNEDDAPERITAAIEACRLLVKWHSGVFDGGKQALRFDNGYPVDRTDVDEAARLAKEALGPTIWVVPAPAPEPTLTDAQLLEALLCDDCPPMGYPTDKMRCRECPRRKDAA